MFRLPPWTMRRTYQVDPAAGRATYSSSVGDPLGPAAHAAISDENIVMLSKSAGECRSTRVSRFIEKCKSRRAGHIRLTSIA